MLEKQKIKDVTVDRREETVITQLHGYTATKQIVRDVAAERRLKWYEFYRIMWSMLALLEILLAIRVVLRLIGANPSSGFAILMYGFTGVIIAPFVGLVATPVFDGGSTLEISTLIGMAVYALIFWGLTYYIRLLVDRPKTSVVIRATREESAAGHGNVRITHTTIANKKL